MRAMLKFGLVLGLLVVAPLAVAAAECSSSVYFNAAIQAESILGPLKRCEAYTKRRNFTIAGMCNVCGSTVSKTLKFDRYMVSHASCFKNDPKIRKSMRQIASVRKELNFIRRGCGY
jgi:hypothetical protein